MSETDNWNFSFLFFVFSIKSTSLDHIIVYIDYGKGLLNVLCKTVNFLNTYLKNNWIKDDFKISLTNAVGPSVTGMHCINQYNNRERNIAAVRWLIISIISSAIFEDISLSAWKLFITRKFLRVECTINRRLHFCCTSK